MSRQQVMVAGATGKRRTVQTQSDAPIDRRRANVRDAISIDSPAERLQRRELSVAAKARRDAERALEIAEMFGELTGYDDMEQALVDRSARKRAYDRDRYQFDRYQLARYHAMWARLSPEERVAFRRKQRAAAHSRWAELSPAEQRKRKQKEAARKAARWAALSPEEKRRRAKQTRERIAADPARQAKEKARGRRAARKRWAAAKADPVKCDAMLEQKLERQRLRRAKPATPEQERAEAACKRAWYRAQPAEAKRECSRKNEQRARKRRKAA